MLVGEEYGCGYVCGWVRNTCVGMCGWVRSMGMCVCVWGGRLEGYAFCCNKLDFFF